MKYYIASKYENKQAVQELRDKLNALGHEITEDWTISTEENNHKAATDCWTGVRDCYMFIGLFDSPYNFKGAFIEFGMAIAYGKYITIIGHCADNQVFIHLSYLDKYDTVDDFIQYITSGR